MANYITNDTELTSVANAIRQKGGTNASLTYPDGFISAISDINTDGGSSSITGDDVKFYDYDGTLVAGYSAADFAALTEMPSNPSHEGLTAQGWNWSLIDAKAYVTKYGKLNIGQMYITDDGKTRVYIHIEEGRTSPMLGVCPNGTVDVDWGDGTEHDTLTGTSVSIVVWTPTHNYAAPGDYVIKLTVTGTMGFSGDSNANTGSYLLRYSSIADNRNYVYRNAITKIEIGNGISDIIANAFNYCYSLSSIVIPDGVTNIGASAFYCCYSLSSIVIPDGVTSIKNGAFYCCYSLSSIVIPAGVTSIENSAFNSCYSLSSIVIPDGVTSIGSSAFQSCYSLSSITIPDSVTSIANAAFQNCYSLSSITIPDSVTNIGASAFYCCYSLSSITIPDDITSIKRNAFYSCYSLSSIVIPDGVTSIESNVFNYCRSLSSIVIPDGVTSIEASAFSSCYGIKEYHILPTTPPTLANTTAFNDIPADCVIYVPQGSLEAYQTATNWSKYASYMQEES